MDSTDVNNNSNRTNRRGEHVVGHHEESKRRAPTRTTSSRQPAWSRSLSRGPAAAENDENAEAAAAATAAAVAVPAFWLKPNSSTDQMFATAGLRSRTTSGFAYDTRIRPPTRSTAVGLSSLTSSPRSNPFVAAEAQCQENEEHGHNHHRHSNRYNHLQTCQSNHKQKYNLPAAPQDLDSPKAEDDVATVGAAAGAAAGEDHREFVDGNIGYKGEDEGGWWDTGSHASGGNEYSDPQPATETSRAIGAEAEMQAQRLPLRLKLGSRRRKRPREDAPRKPINRQSGLEPPEPQPSSAAAASPPTTTKKGGGLRSTAGSCFRGRRGSAKPQRCKAVGKAVVLVLLAYSSIFESAQGTSDSDCALLAASFLTS